MALRNETGRINQKRRTHDAIVRAAAELIGTGRDVTMPEIARAALVSEATAYRYFPDLPSLLQEAVAGQLTTPAEALASVAGFAIRSCASRPPPSTCCATSWPSRGRSVP